MSNTAEGYLERKRIYIDGDINNPSIHPAPFSNRLVGREDFVNSPFISYAGRYDEVIKLPEPKIRWHPAVEGTAKKFRGRLAEIFPEFKNLSDEDFKKLEKMRDRL